VTKGEWSLSGYEYNMGRNNYGMQTNGYTTTMPDGKRCVTFCTISFRSVIGHDVELDENGQSDMVNQTPVEHLANATLMAASKDLLEARQAELDAKTGKEIESAKMMCLTAIKKGLNK
jgi:hypothetical protein